MPQSQTVCTETFTVLNDRGLHTRPATELVRCATKYASTVSLTYKGLRVDGKSILGVLMLAAGKNAKVVVEAEGPDAHEAVAAILALSEEKFHIMY